LQGGALAIDSTGTPLGSKLKDVPVGPKVANEFAASRSNTVGTIAMAQSGGDINSATNQFFFNTGNNAGSLDSQKFAVFGKLTDTTAQATLKTMSTTTTKDVSGGTFAALHPTALLNSLPE